MHLCSHPPVAAAITQHQVVVIRAAAALAGGAEDVLHIHLAVTVKGIGRDHLSRRHL